MHDCKLSNFGCFWCFEFFNFALCERKFGVSAFVFLRAESEKKRKRSCKFECQRARRGEQIQWAEPSSCSAFSLSLSLIFLLASFSFQRVQQPRFHSTRCRIWPLLSALARPSSKQFSQQRAIFFGKLSLSLARSSVPHCSRCNRSNKVTASQFCKYLLWDCPEGGVQVNYSVHQSKRKSNCLQYYYYCIIIIVI